MLLDLVCGRCDMGQFNHGNEWRKVVRVQVEV